MNVKTGVLLLVAFGFLLTACSDDDNGDPSPSVKAAFSWNCGDCTAPAEVHFTNESENASSYIWSFGTGHSSEEENPVFTYHHPGTYEVELEAIGSSGSKSVTHNIVIGEKEEAASYMQYELNGEWVYADSAFAGRGEVEGGTRYLTISGAGSEVHAELPELFFYHEETFIGFSPGLNISFYDATFPHEVIFESEGQVTLSTLDTESPGMHLFFKDVNYEEGGVIEGQFSGSISSEDGNTTIEITNGTFRTMFIN
jgi:PKD repeat protein